MVSDSIQPMGNIKPMCENKSSDDDIQDPAKRDYMAGRTHLANGDYTQAVISFHNALKGFEENGDIQGVANASDRLGDTCMAREEYAMAITHYQRAAEICEQEDDSFSQLALNKKMAVAFQKEGEADKAFELFFDMLEHYRLTNNPKGVVEVLQSVGELYEELGQKENAADTYRTMSSIHANFKHNRLAEEFTARADQLDKDA
jgi:tetratricopeptide (TPR) repeat protein